MTAELTLPFYRGSRSVLCGENEVHIYLSRLRTRDGLSGGGFTRKDCSGIAASLAPIILAAEAALVKILLQSSLHDGTNRYIMLW